MVTKFSGAMWYLYAIMAKNSTKLNQHYHLSSNFIQIFWDLRLSKDDNLVFSFHTKGIFLSISNLPTRYQSHLLCVFVIVPNISKHIKSRI